MNTQRGFVVWFYGGEDAPRHALARLVASEILDRGTPCEVLVDGLPDHVTPESFDWLLGCCRMLVRNGVVAVGSASGLDYPGRQALRTSVGGTVLVRLGDDSEDPPDAVEPEVVGKLDQDPEGVLLDRVVATLEILERISLVPGGPYTPEEEDTIKRRLQNLGYI